MVNLLKYVASLVFLLLPTWAFAATLTFSPSSTSVAQGDTVSVNVMVGSSDQAMNAASGLIIFPNDTLDVVSISKAGSIATLWVQEPSFSNSAGTVSFEGVVLNPGFTGASGKMLTVTFRGKSEGSAKLAISSGSVLANDGQGTEILTGTGNATLNVYEAVSAPAKERMTVISPKAETTITSPTHPDQAKWYSDNSPEFSWVLPPGTSEVRTIVSESPRATPSIRYAPPITEKTVSDLPDGTFYFLLQAKTAGGWGPVAKFQVNIDKTAPEKFRIRFPKGTTKATPQPLVLFSAIDKASGINYYEVTLGEGKPESTEASTEANPYILPKLEPGSYAVSVSAYDRAGNVTTETEKFTIEGLESPTIISYSEEITVGDTLRIKGKSYPDASVEVTISEDGKPVTSEIAQTNSAGDFGMVIGKRLWAGEYTFTARVTDSKGARSPETKPYAVTVRFHFFTDAVTFIVNYFFIVLAFLLGILIIIALGIWSYFKLLCLTRNLKKESEEAQSVLHRSFKMLRGDVDVHIRKLTKARDSRVLTSEEMAFLKHFSSDLSDAEAIIAKEVADTAPVKKRTRRSTPKAPPENTDAVV